MQRSLLRLIPLVLTATISFAQSEYNERALAAKKRFMEREHEAISEPFIGVRTSEGLQPNLFKIEATGESTAAIATAGNAFLKSLTPAQLAPPPVRLRRPRVAPLVQRG